MQSTKCSGSRFRGCRRNGKFKQLEKRFNSVYMHGIRFLPEHLGLLEHRDATSPGKPMSILRVKAEKKFSPFVPSW